MITISFLQLCNFTLYGLLFGLSLAKMVIKGKARFWNIFWTVVATAWLTWAFTAALQTYCPLREAQTEAGVTAPATECTGVHRPSTGPVQPNVQPPTTNGFSPS